jgi:hypothetical protein
MQVTLSMTMTTAVTIAIAVTMTNVFRHIGFLPMSDVAELGCAGWTH